MKYLPRSTAVLAEIVDKLTPRNRGILARTCSSEPEFIGDLFAELAGDRVGPSSSRQQAVDMLRTADMLDKHGQLVDRVAALEAVPAHNLLSAKAMENRVISRRGFLRLGMALASVAACGGCAVTPGCAVADTTFPGIRWFPGLGVHTGAQPFSGDASFVQSLYNEYAAPRESEWFLTTPRHWFTAEKKINWRDFHVDETKAPASHEHARDPNWSNYWWNQSDAIAAMMEAPCIMENKAKLGIFIAMTATAEQHPVPQWMMDKGLVWQDGDGKDHVRLDLEDGWRYMADFLVAFVKRYGLSSRLGTLVIGEYYPKFDTGGGDRVDRDAYRSNIQLVWQDVIANAPRNTKGNRLNILQSNPIMTGGIIKTADIAELGLGVTGSDPYLFENGCGEPDGSLCDPGSIWRARQDLYGIVPLQHQGNNAVFETNPDKVTWTGIENPFGYTRGQVVPIRLEHAAWYLSSKGIVPLNSMNVKNSRVLREQWFGAFDRFGPNGSDAAAWGQIPNYP